MRQEHDQHDKTDLIEMLGTRNKIESEIKVIKVFESRKIQVRLNVQVVKDILLVSKEDEINLG